MKLSLVACALLSAVVWSGAANAQVAGATQLGVEVNQLQIVAKGWSAKQKLLGKSVYNDNNDKVGNIEDLIIAPDTSVSFAIIGVGGFLGMGEHRVAIPANQFRMGPDGKIVLPGATKDALKAMPTFTYNTNK